MAADILKLLIFSEIFMASCDIFALIFEFKGKLDDLAARYKYITRCLSKSACFRKYSYWFDDESSFISGKLDEEQGPIVIYFDAEAVD
jgi:hypothetical protein